MKKIVLLIIAIVMLIIPVLSFAESAATDTTVQISINQEVLASLAGEDAASYAVFAQLLALKFHTQSNQFSASVNMGDFTIADLIFEIAEQGLIISSRMIDDNAILISAEDLNELLSTASVPEDANNNSALSNLNLEHTFDVVQNVIIIGEEPVESWEGTSDTPTSLYTISISSDAFLKIMDAVFEDIKASGAAEELLKGAGENRDYETVVAESNAKVAAVMPAEDDFITAMIGVNAIGEPVYAYAVITYVDSTAVKVDTAESDKSAIEKSLITEAYRFSGDEQLLWSCDLILAAADEIVYSYYGLDISIADGALDAMFYKGSQDEESDQPDIDIMASLTVDSASTDAQNTGAFEFRISMADEDDFSDLLTLKGNIVEGINSSNCSVDLYLAGIEDAAGSILVSTVPGETLASIANKTLINIKDLNEETLSKLSELAVNNLMGLFGSLMSISE